MAAVQHEKLIELDFPLFPVNLTEQCGHDAVRRDILIAFEVGGELYLHESEAFFVHLVKDIAVGRLGEKMIVLADEREEDFL